MSSGKRVITIVGGGQSGLQLGNGLLSAGYDVRLVQDRRGDDIRTGKVMSSQCMFDKALSYERELGLNFWDKECPTVDSISFSVPAPDGSGNKAIDWNGMLDKPAQSVDQRVKFPRWMQEFEKRGGTIEYKAATPADLENYAAESDLVDRRRRQGRHCPGCSNATRKKASSTRRSARSRSPTCKALTPRPHHSAVNFQSHPGRRRIFRLPVADHDRPVRDHGVRRRSRRPDGLLGRNFLAGRASGQIEMDPRHVPALGGRARQECRTDRRQRHPRRAFRADRAQADRAAAVRQGRARHGRRGRAQRPDHRPGLQQRLEVREDLSRRDPGPRRQAVRRRPGCRRRSTATGIMRNTSPAGPTPCCSRRRRMCSTSWARRSNFPCSRAASPMVSTSRSILFPWFAVPEEADKYLKSLAA